MALPEHGDEQQSQDPGSAPPSGSAPRGAVRRMVERRSAVPLVWLTRGPRRLVLPAMGLLFIAGLAAPGPASALCLVLVAAFLGWLAFLAWPSLDRRQRLPRVLVVVVVLFLALARALGH
ncbi:DUF6703 family protein [Nocardiopsis algeriensis]|uniref:Uncharacterized protein n=1 Tax=Nocardiopsis algeriensis TaxID=1478215 RepID=A0A841ISB5_9ACTN|nr:DUF6703 family protein [Nocardiopsis algeriensis]MBB6121563.1 hypothetical protein [Nocardiopsis algeriensis]